MELLAIKCIVTDERTPYRVGDRGRILLLLFLLICILVIFLLIYLLVMGKTYMFRF